MKYNKNVYICMINKTILLLHGFKRNGIDDFASMHTYFEQYENEYNIINEIYFDNYEKDTLTLKYLNERAEAISSLLKKQEEVIILGYSTGAVVAALIADKLPSTVNIHIWAMVPPIKIVLMKWVPMSYRIWKKERAIKKKIGKERYEKLKSKAQADKVMEKYPVKISIYINTLRKKYQKLLLNKENTYYLLANEDTFVHTPRIIKKLEKYNREYEIKDFRHDQLLNADKEVFIEWFESKLMEH